MSLKSNFTADHKKEQAISFLLDKIYDSRLKNYTYKRVSEKSLQYDGVDVIFINRKSKKEFYIDEKAQLDYINENLPTFAFELTYLKNGTLKTGWFFDEKKKTEFYALVTGIYKDSGEYSSCTITLVNRKKLLEKLNTLHLNLTAFINYNSKKKHGRIPIRELDQKSEGYLFFSAKNKVEKPLNLILRLEWLLKTKIAKRLS